MKTPAGLALILIALALAACSGTEPPVLQEVQFAPAPAAG